MSRNGYYMWGLIVGNVALFLVFWLLTFMPVWAVSLTILVYYIICQIIINHKEFSDGIGEKRCIIDEYLKTRG